MCPPRSCGCRRCSLISITTTGDAMATSKAATLLIDVQADIAKIRKDFDDAGNVVKDFGAKVDAVGATLRSAFVVAGITLAVNEFRKLVSATEQQAVEAAKL